MCSSGPPHLRRPNDNEIPVLGEERALSIELLSTEHGQLDGMLQGEERVECHGANFVGVRSTLGELVLLI